jgi:hypothetical protein
MNPFAPRDALSQRSRGEPDSRSQLEYIDTAENLAEQPSHPAGRMDLRRDHLQ